MTAHIPQDPQPDRQSADVNRRTIIGAAAWAAPAIALTTVTPAVAASLGTISIAPAVPTVLAGATSQSTAFTLSPAGSNVPITLTIEPEGAVTWGADPVSMGTLGKATVRFATELTEAQVLTAVATARGYAPLSFTIEVIAAPLVAPEPGSITYVSGPDVISVDSSPSNPLILALDPVKAGATISLRSEPDGALTFSTVAPVTNASGRVEFAISTTIETRSTAQILASADGYADLVVPISIVPQTNAESPYNPVGDAAVWIQAARNSGSHQIIDGHYVTQSGRNADYIAFQFLLEPPLAKGETATVTANVTDVNGNPSRFTLDQSSWEINGNYVQTRWATITNLSSYPGEIGVLTLLRSGSGVKLYFMW